MKRNGFVTSAVCLALLAFCGSAAADFVEQFKGDAFATDPQAHHGWAALAGSGEATVSFTQQGGHGLMVVDARHDRRNIWWAVIKRSVSASIDQKALLRSDRALRIEAKIRLSAAPRRVNLSLNHTRTTDFHANLAEFDIPDTGWHTISYTAKNLGATPADEVFAQLALMDAGRERYTIEIASFKVAVVDPKKSGPDLGNPLPYRPAIAPLASFTNAVPVLQDAIVDSAYPWVNFRVWTDMSQGDASPLLAVSGSQMILLRWDFSHFKNRVPAGWGVLELTTHNVHWAPTNLEEFGYLRLVEIKDGDPVWDRDTVTQESFFQGKPELDVLNGQLVIDTQPEAKPGGKTLLAISPPVLQRLLSGKTKGLAIYAQGEVSASFASSRSPREADRPKLRFNVK